MISLNIAPAWSINSICYRISSSIFYNWPNEQLDSRWSVKHGKGHTQVLWNPEKGVSLKWSWKDLWQHYAQPLNQARLETQLGKHMYLVFVSLVNMWKYVSGVGKAGIWKPAPPIWLHSSGSQWLRLSKASWSSCLLSLTFSRSWSWTLHISWCHLRAKALAQRQFLPSSTSQVLQAILRHLIPLDYLRSAL